MKEKVLSFFQTDWTMSEKCLLITDIFLLGILIGWLTSPIKKGIAFLGNPACGGKDTCKKADKAEEE